MPGIGSSTSTMMQQIMHEGFRLTYSLRPELSNLRVPALFIWGGQDKLGPPELGREMAAIAPRALFEVVENAGHLPWLDQADQCVKLTSDFLRG